MTEDSYDARGSLSTGSGEVTYYSLKKLDEKVEGDVFSLPFSIRVMLESLLRNAGGKFVSEEDVEALAHWPESVGGELAYLPARVVMQDFTGVPAIVDLAAMRSAMKSVGGDPAKINPLVPTDLVIDHSVQVDAFGSPAALQFNAEREFERNRERYEFLKWGQQAFDNFSVVPPATGIIHQVNLEYLAKGVDRQGRRGDAGHAGRHRQPHHHDQRPRRPGLGRGRHRGRGRHAGPALLHARPRGHRLQADRRPARRRHRHRPRPHRDPDAALPRRRRQVRGVLRRRAEQALAAGPRDDREHVARVRGDVHVLPRGRGDAAVPARHGTRRGARRARRDVLQGAGPVAHRRDARAALLGDAGAGHGHRRVEPRRPAPPAGPGRPHRHAALLPAGPRRHGRSGPRAGGTASQREHDPYDEADAESFPASDTPNPAAPSGAASTGEGHATDDTESFPASDTPAGPPTRPTRASRTPPPAASPRARSPRPSPPGPSPSRSTARRPTSSTALPSSPR